MNYPHSRNFVHVLWTTFFRVSDQVAESLKLDAGFQEWVSDIVLVFSFSKTRRSMLLNM